MRIGSVVAPGPVVKLATTRSSSDSVKASIQPDAIAGRMSGSVTVKNVLSGGDDAATKYFRSKTESTLTARFLPIVTSTVTKVGLARQYDSLAGKAANFGLIKQENANIEKYVTQKALDGLYLVMAEEEKALRENPIKAGTDLTRRIFDALRR